MITLALGGDVGGKQQQCLCVCVGLGKTTDLLLFLGGGSNTNVI